MKKCIGWILNTTKALRKLLQQSSPVYTSLLRVAHKMYLSGIKHSNTQTVCRLCHLNWIPVVTHSQNHSCILIYLSPVHLLTQYVPKTHILRKTQLNTLLCPSLTNTHAHTHAHVLPEKKWALKPFLETVLSDLNSILILLYWEVMTSGTSVPQYLPCSLESGDKPLRTST